eukprot:TRINITY_DN3389_c0_g1_i2.p1 TRINITY_DN3389_c0_g1~~TRINITY_DN3389_c0_g1_i2.p1  ORF type:complete len:252 (-),score=61.10 TRINITY_DN3389_c0_g1_i2:47-802(-)
MTSSIQVNCTVAHTDCSRRLLIRGISTVEQKHFDAKRSVFVDRVPFHYHAESMKSLMSCFGDVESVVFPEEPSTMDASRNVHYRKCYVTFESEEGRDAALLKGQMDTPLSVIPDFNNFGMNRWREQYKASRPNPDNLEETLNQFLELFQENEENEESDDDGEPEVDEEGFTMVKTKKRKRLALRSAEDEEDLQSRKAKKLKEQEQAGTVPVNFYRFSRKCFKKEQVESLKKRFQQDRAKLREVLSGRKFRG